MVHPQNWIQTSRGWYCLSNGKMASASTAAALNSSAMASGLVGIGILVAVGYVAYKACKAVSYTIYLASEVVKNGKLPDSEVRRIKSFVKDTTLLFGLLTIPAATVGLSGAALLGCGVLFGGPVGFVLGVVSSVSTAMAGAATFDWYVNANKKEKERIKPTAERKKVQAQKPKQTIHYYDTSGQEHDPVRFERDIAHLKNVLKLAAAGIVTGCFIATIAECARVAGII